MTNQITAPTRGAYHQRAASRRRMWPPDYSSVATVGVILGVAFLIAGGQ
jgi:hypothetical protein